MLKVFFFILFCSMKNQNSVTARDVKKKKETKEEENSTHHV